jgi:hypothetical protein
MKQYSTEVSREATSHIIKKAIKIHLRNVRHTALTKLSLEKAGLYPAVVTSQLMAFSTLTPSVPRKREISELLLEIPLSPTCHPSFAHSPAVATPSFP